MAELMSGFRFERDEREEDDDPPDRLDCARCLLPPPPPLLRPCARLPPPLLDDCRDPCDSLLLAMVISDSVLFRA
jgi:hypothetical protein